jgi:transcriptional regulator with XRE-family HTH domain
MFVIRKPEEYEKAVALRRQGWSVRAIAECVGVSTSTASRWVQGVELSAEHAAALAAANPAGSRHGIGQRAWSEACRRRREDAQQSGREQARKGTVLHAIGCMLYWAEGSKSPNNVIFTNSDVEMLRLFVRFLRECYEVPNDRIRLSVNCFLGNGLSLEEIEQWWLDQLNLDAHCLRAPAVNRSSRSSKGVRSPLVYGTARLVVHSTELAQQIRGAIQEYASFTRPEWLDARRGLPLGV